MPQALLVIDMQHGLCSGEQEAFDAPALIGRINHLVEAATQVEVPVIFVQHEEADGALRHGSAAWALDPRLAAPADVQCARKTTPDSFLRTGLHALLTDRGIDRLVICGLQSDYCVDTTVRRALALGYPVTLVSDGHSTVDNGVLTAAQISAHHNATLRNMQSFGPRVTLIPAADVRFGA